MNDNTDRRVDKLEGDLTTLTDRVISLSDLAVQTNTNVETLINQMDGVFKRTQPKPTNWSVVIAGLSLMALVGTLTLSPVYKEIQEQKDFNIITMRHLESDAKQMGRTEANLEWLKRMEDRSFRTNHMIKDKD